jgi:hypothetical protein
MGKSKKGPASSKAAAVAPKCTCDHPFECSCGNRPPRPSRGHKWDPETQEWGGKGHKQKGASGQTALVAEAAKTTNVGKTQISQWQRMPSDLLKEHCQREKRKPPKFKNVAKDGDAKYLYRIVLPDNKDPDKDLFFVPARGVENEEQAMEEACILALLHQTPNLPHERKLPEPYKTTWLHAVENMKKNDDKKKPAAKNNPTQNITNTTTTASINSRPIGDGAQASTSLILGKRFVSNAGAQRHKDELRRERDKKIRQHEAIRMANKNHPVFLAAHLRNQIQQLLRGDTVELLDSDNFEAENGQDDAVGELDAGQANALDRLRKEGFTQGQVLTALKAVSSKRGNINEDQWDSFYEECLQWLCIHLDEDNLPEGFDPRGGTLDVIVPTSNSKGTEATQHCYHDNQANTKVVSDLASRYGISKAEAQLVIEQSEANNCDHESVLWKTFQKAAGATLESASGKNDENLDALQEELETLEAIFSCDFEAKKAGTTTILTIKLTDEDMTIAAVVEDGVYPSAYPKRLMLYGSWPKSQPYGAAIHTELIQFMFTLDLGSPMIFEIYNHAKDCLHSISSGGLPPLSLLSALGETQPMSAIKPQHSSTVEIKAKEKALQEPTPRRAKHRPRERSTFWSTPPKQTPAATAFPSISKAMDRARRSLPAYAARKDFLAVMSKAEEVCLCVCVSAFWWRGFLPTSQRHVSKLFVPMQLQGGRVMLVTGDTG